MASQPEDQYIRYEKGGLRFLLPDFLELASHIPHLYAHAENPSIALAMEFSSNRSLRRATEELLQGHLEVDPWFESRIIRKGKTEAPFPGHELIFETRNRRHPVVSFSWRMLFYTGCTREDEYTQRSGSEFLDVSIYEFREFSPHAERRWRTMIDSIVRLPS